MPAPWRAAGWAARAPCSRRSSPRAGVSGIPSARARTLRSPFAPPPPSATATTRSGSDRAYLEWKYRLCPTRDYAVDEAWRGSTLAGFVVTRDEEYRGLRLGWIIDCFASRDDDPARDALVGAALDRFRRAGVARAQAF